MKISGRQICPSFLEHFFKKAVILYHLYCKCLFHKISAQNKTESTLDFFTKFGLRPELYFKIPCQNYSVECGIGLAAAAQYLLNTFSAPLQNNCPWSREYVYFLLFTIFYSIYEYDKRVRKKTYAGQQKWAWEQLLKISLMLLCFTSLKISAII